MLPILNRFPAQPDAAQIASIEFFHWLAIALDRRRLERFQRIDSNGRRRMSATMLAVARSKTPSRPLVCCPLDQNNELRPLIAGRELSCVPFRLSKLRQNPRETHFAIEMTFTGFSNSREQT